MRVGVRGAGDLPEPEAIAVGLAGDVRVEDARHVGLGLDVEHGRVLVGAEGRGTGADRAGDVRGLARPDERQSAAAPAVHEEAVEGARERLHAVVVGDERERGLRLAGGDDALRPQPAHAGAGAHRAGDLREDVERDSRPRDARATRSVRDRSPSGPCPAASAPGTSTFTSTGPPSTPIRCADTPTHASPRRRISSCVVAHSGSASTPPLTFSHSTTTVPLNAPGHSGAARGRVFGTARCRRARTSSGRPRRARRSPCTTSPCPMRRTRAPRTRPVRGSRGSGRR